MKKSLVALATAGVLASGAAFSMPGPEAATALQVQYTQYDRQYDRQYDPQWHYGSPRDGNPRDDVRQHEIDERQGRLLNRIERNYQNGRLSRQEWRSLRRELSEIEGRQQAFEADGRLGPRETRLLQDDMDRLAVRLREMRLDGW